jgi:hypothetical protein
MFVHIWKMRARKKRVEDYEKFGRQVTLPSLKKIDGCVGAHFIKVFQSRKPEYLWVVYWRDHKTLEQARTNPLWREQIKRFEAGNYYKSIPLELVCEAVESFTSTLAPGDTEPGGPVKATTPGRPKRKATGPAGPGAPVSKQAASRPTTGPAPEGE